MIFLDKNHSPDGITKVVDMLDDMKDLNIRKVALVPWTNKDIMSTNENLQDNDLSIFFFLKCYLRILRRNDHITLSNENP